MLKVGETSNKKEALSLWNQQGASFLFGFNPFLCHISIFRICFAVLS